MNHLYPGHKAGDVECGECWSTHPKRCTCGGLVHAEFGDYVDWDSYYLDRECDQCGGEYEEVEDTAP